MLQLFQTGLKNVLELKTYPIGESTVGLIMSSPIAWAAHAIGELSHVNLENAAKMRADILSIQVVHTTILFNKATELFHVKWSGVDLTK